MREVVILVDYPLKTSKQIAKIKTMGDMPHKIYRSTLSNKVKQAIFMQMDQIWSLGSPIDIHISVFSSYRHKWIEYPIDCIISALENCNYPTTEGRIHNITVNKVDKVGNFFLIVVRPAT